MSNKTANETTSEPPGLHTFKVTYESGRSSSVAWVKAAYPRRDRNFDDLVVFVDDKAERVFELARERLVSIERISEGIPEIPTLLIGDHYMIRGWECVFEGETLEEGELTLSFKQIQ